VEHSAYPGISSLFFITPVYSGSRRNGCAQETRAFSFLFSVYVKFMLTVGLFWTLAASHGSSGNLQSLFAFLGQCLLGRRGIELMMRSCCHTWHMGIASFCWNPSNKE
jgi:hypothetical protein